MGANHQKDTDESQAALKKGQADLDESRAEIMRQVMAYDKQQRAQDKAQDEHDNLQKTQASEMKGLRKAHQDIQDEDAQQPPDEDCETPAP